MSKSIIPISLLLSFDSVVCVHFHLQILAFILAGITAISFGLEIVIFTFVSLPVVQEWNLTGLEYGFLPSSTGVTNIVGGFVYSFLCDSYGRVWPYSLALFHLGAAGLTSAFSPNFAVFLALRDITSLALPAASGVLFTTFVEFLPIRNRGKMMVSVLVIQSLGTCMTGGLAWWLIPTYKKYGWRYLVIATTIPQFAGAIFRLFVFPLQSPRFLIAKGRLKEAKSVFERMARLNGKQLTNIIPEGETFEDVIEVRREKRQPLCSQFWKSLLSMFKPPYLTATILVSIIYVTSTGTYFCSSIFLLKVLDQFHTNPYFASFFGYLGQIPGILLMSIIIEWRHVGRINSLRFFTLITVGSFLLFAFVRNEVATPVLTVFLYFGMVPQISVLFTYMSEVYPTDIRTTAITFFNSLSALFDIAVPYFSGYLSDISVHWIYPTVWAGVYFFQFIVSLFLRRETLGRHLHDTASTRTT